jgi:hypothetical protein
MRIQTDLSDYSPKEKIDHLQELINIINVEIDALTDLLQNEKENTNED